VEPMSSEMVAGVLRRDMAKTASAGKLAMRGAQPPLHDTALGCARYQKTTTSFWRPRIIHEIWPRTDTHLNGRCHPSLVPRDVVFSNNSPLSMWEPVDVVRAAVLIEYSSNDPGNSHGAYPRSTLGLMSPM
jgi:hypothetical protein